MASDGSKNCKQYKVDFKPLKVRIIRIELSENEVEVLAISLFNKDIYTFDHIKSLYDRRWGVEEEIKKFMQRLIVEFFSSIKENGVLQDFYANIFNWLRHF